MKETRNFIKKIKKENKCLMRTMPSDNDRTMKSVSSSYHQIASHQSSGLDLVPLNPINLDS